MGFRDGDLTELMEAIGGDIEISLDGVQVKTITGRVKKEYVDASPFEVSATVPVPVLSCKTSDLVGITSKHVFTADGKAYRFAKDGRIDNAGLTRAALTGAR